MARKLRAILATVGKNFLFSFHHLWGTSSSPESFSLFVTVMPADKQDVGGDIGQRLSHAVCPDTDGAKLRGGSPTRRSLRHVTTTKRSPARGSLTKRTKSERSGEAIAKTSEM